VPDVRPRDVDGRAAFADARVVYQDLHAPAESLAPVAVVGDVELLDLQAHSTLGRLPLQRLDLAVDLDGGDDGKALCGQAHGGLVAEAGTRTGDEDLPEG
jgi:hypothetical protein